MKGTGIFATDEEREHLQELVVEAQNTPVILLFGKHDLSGDAWKKVADECHATALSHGLPEIEGVYGMDEAGEFVTL